MKTAAFVIVAAVLSALVTVPAYADVVGRASVVDGDTLEIRGERIRLWGVDAPESEQICNDAGRREYRCGQKAALELSRWLGARSVSCSQLDTDRYGRAVSRCRVAGNDLGAWLVSRGLAVEYREYSRGAYAREEARARAAKAGMWAGRFVEPAGWRRQGRGAPAARSSASAEAGTDLQGCTIKGNINSEGERIYHSPDMRSYAETQINPARGERWFCSEAEARSAGWRAPRG